MVETVKVSWSGGKDSTCALSMHMEQGHKVKAVCYVPMFTSEIPLLTKTHHQFIVDTAEKFRGGGADVHIVSGKTYLDFFLHRATAGKNKGRMFCFPPFIRGMCNFKRNSKEKAIKGCDVGWFDYEDIGIAFDEVDRQGQLTDKKRSILVEQKITERMAKEYCREHGILSPRYEKSKRDGCALCPNAKSSEREEWFHDYPEAVELVKALQRIAMKERPGMTPLRNSDWFIWEEFMEGYQYTIN